jgi:hypothetical protein
MNFTLLNTISNMIILKLSTIDLLPFEKCLTEIQIFLIFFLKKSLNSPSIELFFQEK